MSKEAMKLALEALEDKQSDDPYPYSLESKAITALREALAEQPAQQEIDWKDQYEKQKRRADMWVAKYEADIGPLEKAGPMAAQQEPKQSDIFCGVDFADGLLSVSVLRRRADDVAELLHLEQIALPLAKQPAQQEPVAFLANGTRFKISYDSRQSGGQIHGIPPELGGRWVAFVAADDDCHLKLTSPPAQRTWVGLTEGEVDDLSREMVKGEKSVNWLSYSIEAKLKEKNT